MSELPLSIGTMHFTGIGGIGMSGIAEILFELGYAVQGSDMSDNANVRRLRDKGIPIITGQAAENINNAALVVISTAIKPDNPEVVAARAKFLPIVHRAEMLGELMRLRWSVAVAGTHGKTTTTSLVATLLDSAGVDPTVINGGIITGWGSNAKLGHGQWMVVEADESDGSFSKLNPTVAVVTNIDPEHLDHHGTYEALEQAFLNFVASIPFYGFATLCIDHPAVQRMMAGIKDRRVITYGMAANADVRAVNLRHDGPMMVFDVILSDRDNKLIVTGMAKYPNETIMHPRALMDPGIAMTTPMTSIRHHDDHPHLSRIGTLGTPVTSDFAHDGFEEDVELTPMEAYLKQHYASIVGSMIYIMTTCRPDIAFVTGKLSAAAARHRDGRFRDESDQAAHERPHGRDPRRLGRGLSRRADTEPPCESRVLQQATTHEPARR